MKLRCNGANITSLTRISTTTIPITITRSTQSKFYCYDCNSYWKACDNPIDVKSLIRNQIQCSGFCYVYRDTNLSNLVFYLIFISISLINVEKMS